MPIVARKNLVSTPGVRAVDRPEIVARPRVRQEAAPRSEASPPRVPPSPAAAAAPNSEPSRPYEIGYAKPPQHTRFKPGQSGNPRGRPKGAKGLKTLVREVLTARVRVRTSAGVKSMTRMDAMLHKITEQALSGNMRALQHLMTLYGASVPDEAVPAAGRAGSAPSPASAADLDQHDLAILEGLRATMAAEMGARP